MRRGKTMLETHGPGGQVEKEHRKTGEVIWIVLVKNKELYGEPDVWFALHTGTEEEAKALGRDMEAALIAVGNGRCVSRVRPMEPGRSYRVAAVMIPGPLRHD
jgi:hypothetical protein